MADSAQEKTEAPSEKRRSESREKGTVAKSSEVNSVLVLITSMFLLQTCGEWMMENITDITLRYIRMISHPRMDYASLVACVNDLIWVTAKVSLPVVLGVMVIGVVANLIQVGFLFTLQPLQPKLEKINPIAGFGRLFSMRSLVETIKSLVKIGIIGYVAYASIAPRYSEFLTLADASVGGIWLFTIKFTYTIVWRIILVLIVIALLDYLYQRFEFEKSLKMTQEEVKEERKQMEGDPHIKGRIRSLQREMARRRMMSAIPQATVVVTNPTHLAIAIMYTPETMETPKIIAKGKRLIAQKIKSIAAEHAIPIVEDKPLARAMYDKVNVGDDVPVDFFNAVAEILAYVFRLKRAA